MTQELQESLYKKYPKLFVQKDLTIHESCMPWGVECGDGWYTLIDMLCYALQQNIDSHNGTQIEVVQVKEKFGTLRFYTDSATPEQHEVIRFVERMSGYVCEECGKLQTVNEEIKHWGGGWIRNTCEPCHKESEKKK